MRTRNIVITSTAAVVAALAIGSGAAQAGGLIGSRDIADGGVHRVDLGKGLQAKVAKGAQDRTHSAGAGYAGLGAHAEWAPHSWGQTVEKCKAGEVATGGGYSTWGGFNGDSSRDLGGMDKDVRITVSAPYIDSDADYKPVSDSDSRFAADQWVVRGYNDGDDPVDVRAWVICTPAS
jgi:hypothetical protein